MFDIGWSELLLIGIVALIAIGPKELPGALRTFGQWMGKIRRMAGEFQNQFHEAMREAELADLKKEVDEMTSNAGNFANFDPLGDVRRDVEKAVGDLPTLADSSASSAASSAPSPGPTAPPSAPLLAEPPAAAEGAPTAAQSAAPAAEASPADAVVAKPDAGRAPA
jgi:sec-independent protein translocase protein TatB